MKSFSPVDLLQFEPRFSHLEETAIEKDGQVLGWHVNVMGRDGEPLGSGTRADFAVARAVALAETAERGLFHGLTKQGSRSNLALDTFPTTCGFAFGFETCSTRMRAICEAVERWVWSKWIDAGFALTEVQPTLRSPLAQFFAEGWSEIRYFYTKLKVEQYGIDLQLGIAIAFHGEGVFVGSRVCSLDESPWEHALIEVWRHRLISQYYAHRAPPTDLFMRRILYFGQHGEVARQKIGAANKPDFPEPRMQFVVPVLETDSHFLWRALCADYIGWHEGDETRFVY